MSNVYKIEMLIKYGLIANLRWFHDSQKYKLIERVYKIGIMKNQSKPSDLKLIT